MSLRDTFPFSAIFKILDKIVTAAGILKALLAVFKKEKEDADKK